MPETHFTTKKVLTLRGAKEILAAAQSEAARHQVRMVICIVDDGGHLLCLERMDGTQVGSINVAIEKAMTAIRFKRPSKVLEDAVMGGRTVLMGLPGMVAVEGGMPILVDGELAGGIGVSGGTSTQDGEVAAAGLAVMAQWS